jgi:hypothetical protein
MLHGHSSKNEDFAVVIDEANTTTTYVGEAAVASATSAAVWKIQRLVCSNGDLTITWADGNVNYDNIWDNRASLSYS